MEVRDRVWPTVGAVLDERLILAALLAALAAVAIPQFWYTLRIGVTLVHEFGHALVGLAVGRRFTGFVVRGDMSGETVTVGRGSGPGLVLTTWAGYPAPALLGTGLIVAAVHGWASVVLTAVLVVLIISIVRIRSWLTAWVLVVTLAAGGALWWWRADKIQATVLVAAGAFLLVGAWRQCWAVSRSRNQSSDPAQLARLTRIPKVLWLVGFWLVIAASTLGAAWVLADAMGLIDAAGANG